MVDAEMGRDLMSFDCPLLVLGDPAQLPPIQGGGFFTDGEPECDADRGASPGAERSDREDVDGYPRGQAGLRSAATATAKWCRAPTSIRSG